MSEFLVFGAPEIGREEIEEVVRTLESGWVGAGPRVAQFEADFARYKGVEAAAATNSCTAALHLSLIAAGVGPGDEVIVTPMTFAATVNVIIHAGAQPVLADVDPIAMNIDPAAIEAAISPRTRAILPVHFAGRPCEMDPIMAIAERRGLTVIEDCAHAVETEYRGRKAGAMGDFGCFSFYVTKNITTAEGGMVIARDPEALARIRRAGLHGLSKDAWKRFTSAGYAHYDVVECGFKYNMMDIQAAIGIHQLRAVEDKRRRREAVWRRYEEAFADLALETPPEPAPDTRHALHLYTVRVTKERSGIDRDGLLQAMNERGVGCGVHYRAIPEFTYFRERFGWRAEDWPNATAIGREILSLPLGSNLSEASVERVIDAVRSLVPVEQRRARATA